MANGYSRSPVLLKGALIRFDAPLIIPIPNIIIFQYNPESVTRTLTAYDPTAAPAATPAASSTSGSTTARAQPFDPQEEFSLRLILDASDALEKPEFHPIAVASGIADRIAALEMLLYPITEGSTLLFNVSASLGAGSAARLTGDAAAAVVPTRNVPVTLFFWGPGRIVPVRLKSFSVEEQSFSPLLYPTRAVVSAGFTVLTPSAFERRSPDSNNVAPLSAIEEFAVGAYKFTMVQKQILATANLANSVESIINMLPF